MQTRTRASHVRVLYQVILIWLLIMGLVVELTCILVIQTQIN
uniref:Tubby-like F-box protein 3 isoform X2 n=1 Tax=Rhizophora mucronata TaxID=61149 RepID=A0A2P2KEM0_RHIMU